MTLGKVLITAKSVSGCDRALALLRDAGVEAVVRTTPLPWDEDWLIAQARDVEALVCAMEPVSARLLDAATRLRIIARPGVGHDTVDLAAATRHGVAVTVAAGTNDASVADFTFGLLLAATRGIMPAVESVRSHGWERFTGTEAWRKTLAIVGLGRIGRGVARRARGFDMRVLAVSRTPDDAFAAEHGIEYASFGQAIAEADFVSLHAPLTPETENLIDARALARMKRGAYLINTSRGGLVDEQALADAVTKRPPRRCGGGRAARAGSEQPEPADRRARHFGHAAHGHLLARVDGARGAGRGAKRRRRAEGRAAVDARQPRGGTAASAEAAARLQPTPPETPTPWRSPLRPSRPSPRSSTTARCAASPKTPRRRCARPTRWRATRPRGTRCASC